MVGNRLDAESFPLMRAYISSQIERTGRGAYVAQFPGLAEREARSILAETETTWPERWTLYSLRGVREGLNSAIEAERLALAESLAAFVGVA